MESIRCCIIDSNEIYRGIDRAVDMRVFNHERSSDVYHYALEQYLLYLSTEEENTPENLRIVSAFADYVNNNYCTCEVVLYAAHQVTMQSCRFLGIDIIDAHLKSVIKENVAPLNNMCSKNKYNLYCTYLDAQKIIAEMKEKSARYSDLSCVYVYQLINNSKVDG